MPLWQNHDMAVVYGLYVHDGESVLVVFDETEVLLSRFAEFAIYHSFPQHRLRGS
ncbi:hypothetical protein J4464_07325 [Candidatus Woesearchaeota archaeon]|nr:hypothetical protein [Candidatus Woesearchaeota archaeon]